MAQSAEGECQHALAVACLAEASDHPARHDLANEVHARPFLRIAAPARVTHLAVLGEPAAAPAQHLQLVTAFCDALGIAPPAQAARHLAYNGDGFTLKWERHTEFSTFTVVGSGQADEPFADWIDEGHRLPARWRTLVDRKRLVALQIEVLKGEPARIARRDRSRWFGDSGQVGSRVLGGGGSLVQLADRRRRFFPLSGTRPRFSREPGGQAGATAGGNRDLSADGLALPARSP